MKLDILYCCMISIGACKNESFEINIWNDFHFSVSARNLKAYVHQNLTNMLSVKFNCGFGFFCVCCPAGSSLSSVWKKLGCLWPEIQK